MNLICDPASNKSIIFITFVILAPDHFEKRDLIRSTWGNKNISEDFKLIFTIGMSKDDQVNRKIQEEFTIHQDIVQIDNFIDSYYNMTTKIMKSLKWISLFCSNAKYILRINDDVVVNTHQLMNHFKSLPYQKSLIFGYGIFGVGPIRNKDDKFYVSFEEYNQTRYDDYIAGLFFILFIFILIFSTFNQILYHKGSAYILTSDLANTYYNKYLSFKFPPFSIWFVILTK